MEGPNVLCPIVAGSFHYFVLASFFWMLCEAYVIYLKFVMVFRPRVKWMAAKMLIPSYGIPGIVVFINGFLSNYEATEIPFRLVGYCQLL